MLSQERSITLGSDQFAFGSGGAVEKLARETCKAIFETK